MNKYLLVLVTASVLFVGCGQKADNGEAKINKEFKTEIDIKKVKLLWSI